MRSIRIFIHILVYIVSYVRTNIYIKPLYIKPLYFMSFLMYVRFMGGKS